MDERDQDTSYFNRVLLSSRSNHQVPPRAFSRSAAKHGEAAPVTG